LEKPYFEFTSSQVSIAVFYADANAEILKDTTNYKIVRDSIYIGTGPDYAKFLKPSKSKTRDLAFSWRSQIDYKSFGVENELITNYYTETEPLNIIKKQDKLITGDTVALWLYKERFVKK
jgi:uncharacterized lipoprotein YehR (DUF1307 family)